MTGSTMRFAVGSCWKLVLILGASFQPVLRMRSLETGKSDPWVTIQQRCLICVWTIADVYGDEPAGNKTLATASDTYLQA